jgi:hypothetical protein
MEPRSIKLLTSHGDLPLAARLAGHEGRRLTMSVDRPVERDAAIRIDLEDQILLGEVRSCVRTTEGYKTEVELDQAITSVHDLSRLVDALLGQSKTIDDRRRAPYGQTLP